MNNKVVIVKVKDLLSNSSEVERAVKKIISHFQSSLDNKIIQYYCPQDDAILKNLFFLTNKKDYKYIPDDENNKLKELIKSYEENRCLYRIRTNAANLFLAVVYQDNDKKVLYVGEAPIQIKKGTDKIQIYYQIYLKYTSDDYPLIVKNFEKLQVLEEGDFESYMLCCENSDLVKQFRYLIEKYKKKYIINYLNQVLDCNDEDFYDEEIYTVTDNKESKETKSETAQPEEETKNKDETKIELIDGLYEEVKCKENSLKLKDKYCERQIKLNKDDRKIHCSDFQRDYARIVHAKAFRRLVDKAQIFTSSKGDHYRTRMTHTMEVVQIAKAIAQELCLNVELTEAIALAHDIGHTPFGHQGERTLNDILTGKKEGCVLKMNREEDFYGGFKHNLQGVKVVTLLEEKYLDYEGLDLSYQVLEGILKHTKLLSCKACKLEKCKGTDGSCGNMEKDVDGFLPDNFEKEKLFLGYNYATTLEGQVVAIADEIAQRSHDIDDALRSKLISFKELKDYLSLDKFVELRAYLEEIEKNFNEKNEEIVFIGENDILHERVISDIIAFFIKKLCDNSRDNIETYIKDSKQYFEDNHRVNEKLIEFDKDTNTLCKYLEGVVSKKVLACNEVACFDNKADMIVLKLFNAYYNKPLLLPQSVLKRIYNQMLKEFDNVINLTVSDVDVVREEIRKITNPDEIKLERKDSTEQGQNNNNKLDIIKEEYFEKQKILVRAIVDYIAGMTDSYAVNEYNRIYKP